MLNKTNFERFWIKAKPQSNVHSADEQELFCFGKEESARSQQKWNKSELLKLHLKDHKIQKSHTMELQVIMIKKTKL